MAICVARRRKQASSCWPIVPSLLTAVSFWQQQVVAPVGKQPTACPLTSKSPHRRREPQADHGMTAEHVQMLLQDAADRHHGQRMAVHRRVILRAPSRRARRPVIGALDGDHAVAVLAQRLPQPPRRRNLADDVVVLAPTAAAGWPASPARSANRATANRCSFRSVSSEPRKQHRRVVAEQLLLARWPACRAGGSACPAATASSGWRTGCRGAAWRWSPRGGSTGWAGSRTSRRSFCVTSRARP